MSTTQSVRSSAPHTQKTPSASSNTIAVTDRTLSNMMRRRAHLQFSSIKAGNGPIPIGQPAAKEILKADANSSPGSRSLRSSPSSSNLRTTRESETSASGIPRTLRAKPSIQQMRDGNALETRSPNVVSRSDAKKGNFKSNPSLKNDVISNSPVMRAMLNSKMPQKTITNSPRNQHNHEKTTPKLPKSVISGSGIKVKGTTPLRKTAQEAASIDGAQSPVRIRVKMEPQYGAQPKLPNVHHNNAFAFGATNKRSMKQA